MITCNEPDAPPGGFVVGYDLNVHSSIEYHCEVGHKLVGENTLTCNSNGEWSGEPPICECKYYLCGYKHFKFLCIYCSSITETTAHVIYFDRLDVVSAFWELNSSSKRLHCKITTKNNWYRLSFTTLGSFPIPSRSEAENKWQQIYQSLIFQTSTVAKSLPCCTE